MSPAPLFTEKEDTSPVVIATDTLKKKRFSKKVVFASLAIFFVVTTIGLGVFTFTDKAQRGYFSTTATKPVNPIQQIKKSAYDAFGTSNKYQSIIDYINLAQDESNLSQKYKYYKKAFSLIQSEYLNKKDPKILLVLYQIKNYVKTLPDYQEGDFVIQK